MIGIRLVVSWATKTLYTSIVRCFAIEKKKQKGSNRCGKTLVSRAVKKQGVEKTVFPVGPKIRLSTTFNFAEPINSEHKEWLELESVRVNKIAVVSVSRLNGRNIPHVCNA